MWHLRDTFQGPHCPARMGTLSGLSELQDLQSMFLHYNGEGPWLRVKKKVLAHFYPIPSFDFKRLSSNPLVAEFMLFFNTVLCMIREGQNVGHFTEFLRVQDIR